MDVKFRFRQEVTNIEKTKSGKLMSVDIAKVGNPARFVEVPCHNVIVAAGPGTIEALHEIIPWIEPRTLFLNKKQHCDWVRVQGPSVGDADKVALVIHNIAGGDPVIMAGQAHQELIVASTRPRNQHIPSIDSAEITHFPDAVLVARDRFNGITDSTKFIDGHSTISTSLGGLPLVCKIPSIMVDDRFQGEDNYPLGFYLAYGFGMYGITMSLGVATAIRRMMMGLDGDIGEAFDYP
jgi:glycine/D-amino acid oxidase-like deaminating enzyme